MKKILSIISALMFITSVSCSERANQAEQEVTSYTAEKLSDVAAYRKENMAVPESCRQIWSFMPYNNGADYLLLGSGKKTPAFWHTSDFENYTEIEFPEFDISKAYDLDTANDGTVVTFVNHVDYGDLEPVGLYDFPEGYDEELYDANAEYKFMIKTYKDGKLISSADVLDFGVIPDKYTSINGVYSDGETVIAGISGTFEMFTVKGKYIGELSSDTGDIDVVGKNRDGKLICSVAYKEDESDKLKICLINPDGTVTDYNSTVYDFTETPQGIQQGAGEYDFFLWSRSTLFGIKSGTAEIVPLFNINVAGLVSDVIQGFVLADDGNVIVIYNDYTAYSVNFRKYIPRTHDEMDGIPVLTLGTLSDVGSAGQELVNKWNDEGHDFILEYKNYVSDSSVDTNEITEDMLGGSLPDIMMIDGNDYRVNLVGNGALCDLYEFIDSDEEISRDTFVPNALNCFENDGKLYFIPNRFWLDAGEVAKTKFVGDGSDWSFDKYVDMVINPPVDIEMEYDSKYGRFGEISYEDWIDKENLVCHYTDDSFVKYLEWCNIPEDIMPEYPDFSQRTEEEEEADCIKTSRKHIDDTAIFSYFGWGTYESYVRDTRGVFGGEDITYLETPYLSGNYEFAISSTSENKELAWEFVKSTLTDDNYITPAGTYIAPFPITKSGLKIYEEQERTRYTDFSKYDEITDPEWRDYKGVTYQLGFCIYGDNVMQLGEITDDDVQFVNDMIARAEPSDSVYLPFDESFHVIINEEIESFFHYEITAEECAEHLQNRVSIYLSERFN